MALLIWRHPQTIAARGICLGRLDVLVDRRKIKRLAHRIRAHARRHGGQRSIVTSRLQRSRAVGEMLATWGWSHRVDDRLDELDFGSWTGRAWSQIGKAEVDAWTSDFAAYRPGGGEPVEELLARCRAFLQECDAASEEVFAVGHAGWISAAEWLRSDGGEATSEAIHAKRASGTEAPVASKWPAAIRYGERRQF